MTTMAILHSTSEQHYLLCKLPLSNYVLLLSLFASGYRGTWNPDIGNITFDNTGYSTLLPNLSIINISSLKY